MMRSMFSGVTGLRNHQIKMDVIGNNIANVNTVGFKKSRVTFQDTLSQTMRGAAAPQGNRGGTNPMQVGLGMTIASIDTIHSPSSAESTGNMTDMAIEGDGYFILQGEGLDQYYTRAGNFGFDTNGNLVNTANGLKVLGWQTDDFKLPSDRSPQDIGPIQIRKGMMVQPSDTTEVYFSKNLNAETESGGTYSIPFKVYDSIGCAHNLTITFTKTADNKWDYEITHEDGTITVQNNTGTIAFATDGTYDSANSTVDNPVTFTPGTGAADVEFTVDFSGITQYAKETNIDMTYQDGYTAGTLTGITVDTSGVITGIFDNGRSWPLAQVAIANFDNPAGLIKAGQNMYRSSNNSGEPQIGESGTGGRGTIAPGYLEMSNVDLSEEFTQMIITQRGFQANSRIITASDEMLQELINIKR
ncbi:flagellar hook protein FlgE [Tepidanaerobacter sp. GT38]|uniref:flagellar hook protein FlgE n=1 Tax=Tepidanaerobacter sp. GT38 TaxID=2722793 RepID=UPI001F21EF4B|nr:flagellar hook protein FlgE [Tepidanaerobacter sp. GT38]MCG1012438.1 flagellar hook protein FlgE [Tepidanaerobacter sp. GT38]